MDAMQGRQEFSPTPPEVAQLLKNYYGVKRNLILRFKDDSIDDSIALTTLLQSSSAIRDSLDLSLRTLDGDHVTPLAQAIPDLPPEVARVANQAAVTGGDMLGRLASMAGLMGVQGASGPLEDLSKGVANMANMLGGQGGQAVAGSVQSLAGEVAAWIGIGEEVLKGNRILPVSLAANSSSGSSSSNNRPQAGMDRTIVIN
eukprot:GHRR01034067.1.p1 GENE.GHRR01034067.1~~GHRR01034067.1.p1  ORF type:complete len:201 (+),score=82.87 GHRR01034067.1:275-877(+)